MWLIYFIIGFGIVYDWVTTLWIREWLGRLPLADTPVPPTTFFRPIKPGVSNLEEKLRGFLATVNTSDQILFGTDGRDSTSHEIIQHCLTDFPHLNAHLLSCAERHAPNPKVNKLIQMEPYSQHQHWILLDSEMMDFSHFLPAFRTEWAAADFPVLTAPYRFQKLTLDSVSAPSTLLPGLAILQKTNHLKLTLGACIAITREQMLAVGGWEKLGKYLAEDYQIGKLAADAGIRVALSSRMALLDNDPASLRSTLLHLHRVAVTYRVCQPWGFAGSLINQTLLWAACMLAMIPTSKSVAILMLVLLSKGLVVWTRLMIIKWPSSLIECLRLSATFSVLDTILWFLAWLPFPVFWAGKFWKVDSEGRMKYCS